MSKPFFDQVRQLRKGQFLADSGEALREVKQYVDETRKTGKLVIEINVKPAGKGERIYIMADKVEAKLPKPTRCWSSSPTCKKPAPSNTAAP